jgi:hypothetical protein
MPFDVAGNFTRTQNFQQDRDNGIKILAARVDDEFNNLATGMNAVFFRDGRVPMQADLRMNINRVTGLADGSMGSPAVKFNTDASTGPYLDGLNRYAIAVNGAQRAVFTTAGLDVTGTLSQGGAALATQAFVAGAYLPKANPQATGSLAINDISGNIRSLYFFTAGAYAADISLQADNATIKHSANTAHRFDVGGAQKALISGTGVSAQILSITGAAGAANFQPRDLTANWPVIYSPTSGEIRLNNGGGSDLLNVNSSAATVIAPTLWIGTNKLWANHDGTTGRIRSQTGALCLGAAGGTDVLTISAAGNVAASGLFQSSDMTATRGDGTGVLYLGVAGGTRFLYYDGTSYNLPGANLNLGLTATPGDATLKAASTAFVDALRGLQTRTSAGAILALTDRGNMVLATGAMTVPNAVFAAGDVVTVYNNTAAGMTLTQGAGLTLRQSGTANTGSRTIAQRGFATITFVSSSEAVASGDIT